MLFISDLTKSKSLGFVISTKIKAIDTLNKMSGEYITKVEGNMNISYEDSLKEVADTDEY